VAVREVPLDVVLAAELVDRDVAPWAAGGGVSARPEAYRKAAAFIRLRTYHPSRRAHIPRSV
jgi:hypothetical protein